MTLREQFFILRANVKGSNHLSSILEPGSDCGREKKKRFGAGRRHPRQRIKPGTWPKNKQKTTANSAISPAGVQLFMDQFVFSGRSLLKELQRNKQPRYI